MPFATFCSYWNSETVIAVNEGVWRGFGSLGDDWDIPLTMHTLGREVARLIGC